MRRRSIVGWLALGALLIAACGDDSGDGSGPDAADDSDARAIIGPWMIDDIDGAAVVPGSSPTLVFAADGFVSGSTGCNQVSGTYELDGDTITLGPIATTLRACVDDALAEQETAYVAALEAVDSFTLDEDTLDLLDADGEAVLSATRAALCGTMAGMATSPGWAPTTSSSWMRR